jgi:HD-like signal output (HDOD) protein
MSSAGSKESVDLGRLLAGAQLAALPQSAISLIRLSQDPENGPAEFAVPVEADPGLTGQVLRFVNSSYFGFSREIASVKLAITLVGIRTIKNFALWSAVFSLMPNPKCGPFDLRNLWRDSLRRAIFARTAGKLLGLSEAEDAFAAALLQDMAIPLLAKELPAQYTEMLTARDGGKRRLSDLEQERFGWTHARIAADMARKWNLPPEFATLLEGHTAIETLQGEPRPAPLSIAVTLSSLLPSSSDEAWLECAQFEAAYTSLFPAGSPSIGQIFEKIDSDFAEFAPVLKISAPSKSLADWYRDVSVAAT